MKNKILFLIIIILVSFVLIYIKNIDTFKLNSKLDISKFQTTEKIAINYSLEAPNIKNKNLTQFYFWTLEDPLLTAPGFDIDKYGNAIKMLKNENDIYVKEFNLPGNIYPVSFLNDLISINKHHNKFIDNPTISNAKSLLESYRTAVEDYKQEVLDLKKSTENIIPDNIKNKSEKIYLIEINIVSSLKTYYDDWDKINQNADALNREISKRQACLEKGIGCIRPADKFYEFSLKEDSASFSKKDLVNKDLVGISFAATSAAATKTGPYEVNTSCFGWSDNLSKKSILFDYYKVKKIYPFFDKPIYFTQIYNQFANDRIYHFEEDYVYKDSGTSPTRIFSMPSNDYMCPNAEYKAKLNSINYLYTNYKDKQIFSNLLGLKELPNNIKEFLITGQKLEKKFFNSEFPSETDADNLVNYYGLLYKQILIWSKKDVELNQPWLNNMFKRRIKILNLYLEFKRGLVDVDGLISNLMFNLYTYRSQNEYFNLKANSQSLYVYTARGGWGLVYFPFSKSFYRYDVAPEYILKLKYNNVGENQKYTNLKQLLKKYSLDEINSWYKLFSPKYWKDLDKIMLNM